jgi:cell division protein FtsL
MHEGMKRERSSILRRIIKLTCFFAVLFFLLFCITWQNMHMFNLNRRIDEMAERRNDLERSLYLKNMELASLQSRSRIKVIATEEMGMQPITYKDVKIIVYEP